jgi:hypothetical protein
VRFTARYFCIENLQLLSNLVTIMERRQEMKHRQELLHRKWRRGEETAIDFAEALKDIAAKCNFGHFASERVLDNFILNIGDNVIRAKIMECRSIEEAISIVNNIVHKGKAKNL